MKKKSIVCGIIGFVLVCTIGILYACNATTAQPLALTEFQNQNGQYEYAELPFTSTTSDIAQLFDISLSEADFTQGATSTYILNDIYVLEDAAIQTSLEFCDGTLQTVFFTLETTNTTIEQQFTELSAELVSLYGEASEVIDTSGALEDPLGGAVSSKGMMWSASTDDGETRLQLLMMSGDAIEPNLSIAVGIVPA